MASWIAVGGVLAGGRCSSSTRSTRVRCVARYSLVVRSSLLVFVIRFRLFGVERLRDRFPFRVSEDQFDFLFHLFQLLIAEARQADALLEKLQRLVERHLLALQAPDDLLQFLKCFFEFVRFRAGHIRYRLSVVGCRATRIQRPSFWRRRCTPGGLSSAGPRLDRRPARR